MSLTLTLNGYTSSLENHFFPPIDLIGDWEIGLLNLETFHSIPNIAKAHIKVEDELFDIPKGAYELEDITNFANEKIGDGIVNIKPNRNTLKTEVFCKKRTSVSKELGILLGFGQGITFAPNVLHTSPRPANISRINVIRIDCNIAQGSFLNGKPTHTIHEFFPSVAPGYKIIEVPFTVVYHNINTTQLNTLKIDLLDQNNRHIDFRNENITVRVHLRKH